ncbi:MAG: SusC/RagA family TonB-linked outer membrane protein [Chitinophagaceae bacterium]|nr:SusC/RagA family TonB-linked outer membrane protein [Chitinophagaceae bacterium]
MYRKSITPLLVMFFSITSTIGFAQNVSLKTTNTSVRSVFAEIKKQTGYTFFYDPDLLDKTKKITINVKDRPLGEVLELLFKDQPISYSLVGKLITLSKKSIFATPKFIIPVVRVSGRVRNKLDQPLEGASIMILHVNSGTLTDVKGVFTLDKVRLTDTLVVSMIGYKTDRMAVPPSGDLSIVLKDAVDKLDEVIKTAYGRTSRRLATGDIAKVTAEEIEKQPVLNPMLALQGRVPGLVVTPYSGYASSPVKVELRGRSDLNPSSTSDPLYVIDGVPITILEMSNKSSYVFGSQGFNQGVSGFTNGQSPLFSINPKDIESIEVLKDAGATAIYGSRGAKGVILITTKKGKQGPAQLNLSLRQGITKNTSYWDMLNTSQYFQMRREALKNDAITPNVLIAPDLLLWDSTRYTDWQRAAYGGTGKYTDVSMSLSGGSAQTTFSLRGGYSRVTDITTTSGSTQRATINSVTSYRSLNNKLDLSFTTALSYSDVDVVGFPGGAAVSALPPNAPSMFSGNRNLNWEGWNKGMSPYFAVVSYPFGSIKQTTPQKTNYLNANFKIGYRIFSNLLFSTSFGYDDAHNNSSYFNPITAQSPLLNPTGQAYFSTTDNTNWTVEPKLDYTVLIGSGKLGILAGGTFQSTATHLKMQSGFGYTNDYLLGSIAAAPISKNTADDRFKKYVGVFANINYNLYNKYILDLSARRDGSSRFGPGRQFGNFGSMAFAWIGSEEKWLKEALPSWMNFVKLRGSYGITGSDGIGDYQYISLWNPLGVSIVSQPDYGGISPLISIQAVNPRFQWQTNKKLEGALELGFFDDNRINLSIAWYRERTGNQLVPYPTPLLTGFGTVTANSPALVQNSGVEGAVRATIIQTKNFTWSADFNIAVNRNKLLAFPNLDKSPYATLYRVGSPTTISFALHYTGVDPLTGEYTYQDFNHDGKIYYDASITPGILNDDRRIVIDYAPKYSGGFGTQFGYKGVQLGLNFSFVKQKGVNSLLTSPAGGASNISTEIFKGRWQNPGDRAAYARFTTAPQNSDYNFSSSDGVVVDASYLRLNTLAISYALPQKVVKKTGAKGCVFSIQAQNVFTITGSKGPDPGITGFGTMPIPRTITGDLSFNF